MWGRLLLAVAISLCACAAEEDGLQFVELDVPMPEEAGRSEMRALLTSASEFEARIEMPAPVEIDFASTWTIFYSAGETRSGGARARVLRLSLLDAEETLAVVTSLEVPGQGCPLDDTPTIPRV